jgi:hypothetical protein
MGYLISGNLTNPARLIIMDESDLNSVIYSGEHTAGSYEIFTSGAMPSKVLVVGRSSAGETVAYGNVAPESVVEPNITIGDITVQEDDGTATFIVSLSAQTTATVEVDYETTDGTATAGDDYTATSNTLTFQPGDTAKSVEVTIIDNDDADDDRVFYLDLSNASWGTITDSRSQCTIENEDIAGTIPTDSVISWTNFNGNNSYVGTRMFLGTGDQPKIVFGNVGIVSGVGGKLGGSFNGGSALEYDTMGAWSYNNSSVALWLRADGSINDSVFGRNASATYDNSGEITCYASDSIRFRRGRSGQTPIDLNFGSNINIYDNVYHLIVVTYSSTTGYRFIVDKVHELTSPVTHRFLDSTAPLRAGSRSNSEGGQFLVGDLSQIRMFNKTLTDQEIAALYDEIEATPDLLMHMDSSSFLDSSENGHTLDTNNNVSYSSSNKKIGTGSAEFTSANDSYLDITQSSDFDFGSGDFTVDLWIRFKSTNNSVPIIGNYYDNGSGSRTGWVLQWQSGVLRLQSGDGSNYYRVGGLVWSPSIDTWYHIAMERYSNTFYLYVDGVLQNNPGDSMTHTIAASSDDLRLGRQVDNNINRELDGYIDEVRIVKGTAAYRGSNFTPPTSAYS